MPNNFSDKELLSHRRSVQNRLRIMAYGSNGKAITAGTPGGRRGEPTPMEARGLTRTHHTRGPRAADGHGNVNSLGGALLDDKHKGLLLPFKFPPFPLRYLLNDD
jgi:hypothetical protein